MTTIAIIVLLIFDIYIFRTLDKHEMAIIELLKRHPDMLTEVDDDVH